MSLRSKHTYWIIYSLCPPEFLNLLRLKMSYTESQICLPGFSFDFPFSNWHLWFVLLLNSETWESFSIPQLILSHSVQVIKMCF